MIELRDITEWAAVLRQYSPGDMFRLLHGIRVRFPREIVGLIASPSTFERMKGILSERTVHFAIKNASGGIDAISEVPVFWIVVDALEQLKTKPEIAGRKLWDVCKAELFASNRLAVPSTIWTSFSNKRTPKLAPTEPKFRRIDGTCCDAFPDRPFEGVSPARKSLGEPVKALAVLRKRKEWRSTPTYHFSEAFAKRLANVGVELWYGGLKEENDYLEHMRPHCLPFLTMPIRDQIKRIAGEFHFAFGVNSSALDVASVARLPVVRECEFQQWEGTNHWAFQGDYNRFLGLSANIGLGICREHCDTTNWYAEDRLFDTIKVLLSRLSDLFQLQMPPDKPRHRVFGFQEPVDKMDVWLKDICLPIK